ncbi:glycoside hydrolase family 13 protein [Clostridium botulinum]|uniref:Alpha-amylase n=1 Tax=Clostridium botulinum (strain Langeland / NCTC 10281 / Type F) TaxID=441772 RepID=A7GDT4_CLOBL|nr:alpha-glucosidase [Clostridium botulinum]ABS41478.1 glycosyl hydrolase, family 13 [Clostridium botulinum F str. Langeland]KKM43048.1 oligo-1,6-glucosidase [Clostridium botulinum]MBY6936668.1 alpha-glucosidase [Clostridium botulinum]MBY6944090.1 alpha-glucosidase [Clostridium botulinum]NEZ53247.1 alpha-glucosidase [Clostridium botulinum F str. Langeland]
MNKTWWKEAVAYQIYPRSFKDSNDDGIGDIEGIISKLDYLKDLGIDIIWICPMYKSPNDDNGYDISDYKAIMDEFGTMEDFDKLLQKAHEKGMKLIIDLVINHTSDEHKWFIESRSSKDNPKRDFYIWRDGKDGKEPNNWESIFKGSAWEYDYNTEQYFLHLFSKKQPDLNWENENVRKELYKMINWWLDKGIDGFRVDAISHIKKEKGLKDIPNPKNLDYVPSFEKHMNVEGIQKYLKELKENTFDKYDIITVGEANGVNISEAPQWVGEKDGKFNMIFQFEHLDLWDVDRKEQSTIKKLKEVLSKWQEGLEGVGWNALFIENHDIQRVVSTLGDDKNFWEESSKALALIYFMQKGTPFIYQGQEIGMTNVKFEGIEDYNDIKTINIYKEKIKKGIPKDQALKYVWETSRDNSRTPMQWYTTENAGFSKEKPWMKVNPNYVDINAREQENNLNSILNFYKKIIRVKKENEVLIYGKYNLILAHHEQIYAYTRTLGNEKFIVIANLTNKEAKYTYKREKLNYKGLIISNYSIEKHEDITEILLKPFEARLYKIV